MNACPVVAKLVDEAIAVLSHDELVAIITDQRPTEEVRENIVHALIADRGVSEEQAHLLADMRPEFIAALRRRLEN